MTRAKPMQRVRVKPDTDEWMEERRRSVGASEAAALVGMSDFGETPLSVYLGKLGRAKHFDETLSYVTHAAEPLVEGWVRKFHPELGQVGRGFMARHRDHPWLHATFDRTLTVMHGSEAVTVPLQIKTSHPYRAHAWENGLLPQYQVQEDVECLVMGAPFAVVVVWHYGRDFEILRHWPDPERQSRISDAARDLMQAVADRRPPTATLGDDIAALYPARPGKAIRADQDVYDAWELLVQTGVDARHQRAEQDAVKADAEFVIESFMQDATELLSPDGERLIHTWKPNKHGDRRHFTPKREQGRYE